MVLRIAMGRTYRLNIGGGGDYDVEGRHHNPYSFKIIMQLVYFGLDPIKIIC